MKLSKHTKETRTLRSLRAGFRQIQILCLRYMHRKPQKDDPKEGKVTVMSEMCTPKHIDERKRALIALRDELFDQLCDSHNKLLKWSKGKVPDPIKGMKRSDQESSAPIEQLIMDHIRDLRQKLLDIDAQISPPQTQPVDVQLEEVN